MTYIVDRKGRPLMPTERGNMVRHLLKAGVAKVIRREPFTVMILRDVGHCVQAVTLGVDAGSKHIGLCASTEKKELYSSQVEMREDVSKLLTARREFRRSRRGRKHNWYREKRFNNRANRRNAILPPSIKHKADAHIRAIEFVCKLVPISKVRIEIGKFDTQRIQNPNIEGEQYQRGVLAGWENLKAYAKWRDGGKCRVCGKTPRKDSSVRLEVHHIVRRADGGTDTPENVVTLCRECHEAHHRGERKLKLKRPPMHKGEAHMNSMRMYLVETLMHYPWRIVVEVTYGYETAMERREHGIEKSHANDAYCIAGNFGAERNTFNVYRHRHVRAHNRMLHRAVPKRGGIRHAAQSAKVVHGFRHLDEVKWDGKQYWVSSRRTNGMFKVVAFDGKCVKDGVNWKRLVRVRNMGTTLTKRMAISDMEKTVFSQSIQEQTKGNRESTSRI